MKPLFFFRYVVPPKPDGPHAGRYGETYALCWIDAEGEREADQRARSSVAEAGWRIISLDESSPVFVEEVDREHPSYKFCVKAKQNGEHIFFVTGPQPKAN